MRQQVNSTDLLKPSRFLSWLRDYACRVNAPFLSVGGVRLIEDYLRGIGISIESINIDERLTIMNKAFRELVLPLAKAGYLGVVYLGSGGVVNSIVNVSKIAMNCGGEP
mgnify:CR=1 FL=1